MIRVSRICRSTFQRVPFVTREERDKTRSERAMISLPLGFLEEDVRLASEDEIALANINMRKEEAKEASDQRKHQKVLDDLSNVIGNGDAGPKPKKIKTLSKQRKISSAAKEN